MADSLQNIADRICAAGIVGAGGAGFPTHVKFASRVDTAIANGAECEPLLGCDKAVMRQRTREVLEGLSLLAQATGARRAVIALKGHYRDLVGRVRDEAGRGFRQIEVFELGNFYPAGDEQVLVHEVTGRVVPEGGIPLAVGVVVNNVITLGQVARAVAGGAPVTRRPLTVAGEVRQPLTCELPIGAPLRAAVELAGGARVAKWLIVEGGPMMGRVVEDADQPITKKTSGVLVLATSHPLVRRRSCSIQRQVLLARSACCQCRMCTDLCPRFLLGHAIQPHLAMRALSSQGTATPPPEQVTASYLCCLCGVCEVYACPMGLSPRRVFDRMRQSLASAGLPNPHHRADCTPNLFRAARRIPLPRLVARLGLDSYAAAAAAAAAANSICSAEAPVPWVRILLSQHTGAPAQPVITVGQHVEEGDLIADIPAGKLGARQHASIAGTVTRVDAHEIRIERS